MLKVKTITLFTTFCLLADISNWSQAIQLNVGVRQQLDTQLEALSESQAWAEAWSQLTLEEQEGFEDLEFDGFASDEILLQLGNQMMANSSKNNKTTTKENTSEIELVKQMPMNQTARNEWLFNTFLNKANILLEHKEAIASESFYEFDNKTKTIQRNDAWLVHLARAGLMDFEENMDARSNPVFEKANGTSGSTNMHQKRTALAQHKEESKDQAKEQNSTAGKPKRYAHLIPHSHTSEGFMSTPEAYYTGADSNQIYIGGVRDILDSVINEMIENKNLTFTYAEIKYFKQWYEQQPEDIQQEVKNLVKIGNLDLVSGGWSTPDEAITQYDSILDNFMLGQRWLQEEFEFHPQVSWQVDSYGVSSGYARLAHDVGHNLQMFSKADGAQLQHMRDNKTRVQVWRPFEENFGRQKQILSSLIHQNQNVSKKAYCFAQGFFVDVNYMMDAPLITNKNDTKYDFDKIVLAYYHQLNDQLRHERTNHIFSPFGCDFSFVDAKLNYAVITNLTRVWNELGFGDDIELVISTPTRYLQAMKELDKKMILENSTAPANATANSTSATKEKPKTLAELDKPEANKAQAKPDNLLGKAANSTKDNSTESSNFQETFDNMFFSVNETLNKGWPLRRDDGFPYQEQTGQYWAGYYTSRPQLKKQIREFAQQFHSTQRLAVAQLLRRDLANDTQKQILKNQNEVMELLGNLQHHEAISGTAAQRVLDNFLEKAKEGKAMIDKQNTLLLTERLNQTHGIQINEMLTDIPYKETNANLSSAFAYSNQTLLIVQNPSQQQRSELIDIQLPYYNFTINELVNGQLQPVTAYDKYLPRTWLNSNKTMVRSMVQFKVDFTDSHQIAKVFLIENKGVIRVKNKPPSWYHQKILPWNLNLPLFLQKHPWDIYNFQSNFRKLNPKKDKITAGRKTLKFLGIKPTKRKTYKKLDDLMSQTSMEAEIYNELQILTQNFANSTNPNVNSTDPVLLNMTMSLADPNKTAKGSEHKSQAREKKIKNMLSKNKTHAHPEDTEGAAIFEYIDEETGLSQKFAFNLRYYIGASSVKLKKMKRPKKDRKYMTREEIILDKQEEEQEKKEEQEDKEKKEKESGSPDKKPKSGTNSTSAGNSTAAADGKALANNTNNATAGNQTHAAYVASQGLMRQDGIVEFSPEETLTGQQKSYRYGKIDIKKSQARQNRDSAEYVLMWEQKYTPRSTNETAKVRASARIQINDYESFVKFQVTLNEVPVEYDLTGKDIVADWYLLDDFKMNNQFWVDANGLQMVQKQVNHRMEYEFNSTQQISPNYYPITSAIAVRDHSNGPGSNKQKQIVIMTENSHGASAGLRSGKNIEIMQMRRLKRFDAHGIAEPLDEIGADGKGVRNRANYYLHLTNVAFQNDTEPHWLYKSHQREKQLALDQPFVKYYSQNFQMPIIDDGGGLILTNATNDIFAVQVLHDKVEQGNNTESPAPTAPNKAFKKSKTLKAITYGIKPNEIQLRLTNLEDRFDGNYSNPIGVDLNSWAREFYLEANAHMMVPKDGEHLLLRNSSLDMLDGVMLNITEMNIAGSIPLSMLKDNTSSIRWFNWTTTKDENPENEFDVSADLEVSVPLPKSNHSHGAEVNLLNVTTPLATGTVAGQDMLTRKKSNMTSNTTFSKLVNETVHVVFIDPQQIRTFNIKFLVPASNTNNDTSLANLGLTANSTDSNTTTKANNTKDAKKDKKDTTGDSKLAIGSAIKVATEDKDPLLSPKYDISSVLGVPLDANKKYLVQKQEKEAAEKDVVLGSNANEIPSTSKVQLTSIEQIEQEEDEEEKREKDEKSI